MYVPGHGLLSLVDGARLLRLAHHLLDPLYAPVALVESLCDLLRELFDLRLLSPLGVVVIEPGEDMLLVQPLQALALGGYVGQ